MDITLDLLEEEQHAVREWCRARVTTDCDVTRESLYVLINALTAAINCGHRRLRVRNTKAALSLLEREISDTELCKLRLGTHSHRALAYIKGMLCHELAKSTPRAVSNRRSS